MQTFWTKETTSQIWEDAVNVIFEETVKFSLDTENCKV